MMGYVEILIMVRFPVENNSRISWISYEVGSILSIIQLLYCNTPIDDIDSNPHMFMCL